MLLINPPVVKPCEPPAGIARLSMALKSRGIDCRLYDANLAGANLTGALLDQTDLLNAELSGAIWTDGETLCRPGSVGRCQ